MSRKTILPLRSRREGGGVRRFIVQHSAFSLSIWRRPGPDFQGQPEELSDGDSIAVQGLTETLNRSSRRAGVAL